MARARAWLGWAASSFRGCCEFSGVLGEGGKHAQVSAAGELGEMVCACEDP